MGLQRGREGRYRKNGKGKKIRVYGGKSMRTDKVK